jgi:translation initiation factor eIF-2B subunit alpha/methylthioribose-1-phosphate isomerase
MRVVVKGKARQTRALWMDGKTLVMIDQLALPHDFRLVRCGTLESVAKAIENMTVRGAPSIGAAAAYGMAIGWKSGKQAAAKRLGATRPTARDLFRAIEHMLASKGDPFKAAERYADGVVGACRRIGEFGLPLVPKGARILTHCNAGALATVDYGTALAPMRAAHKAKKGIFVFADETRPRLQGMVLTSWELMNEGIPHAVIADNAAGHFMRRGDIDLVITGADRITLNGDAANKIGTYEKAVLAKENGIPFYVAAPLTTFDFSMKSGGQIPIEERGEDEVLELAGARIAPMGAKARNPAFDVTPAKYITAFITEEGVLNPSEVKRLAGRSGV